MPQRLPRAPRKVLSLSSLEEVTSNPHFWNMFIRFEGESSVLILTAERESDFRVWMTVLESYEAGSITVSLP